MHGVAVDYYWKQNSHNNVFDYCGCCVCNKKSCNFAFEISNKSLNLSPPNSIYLENSKSISCHVRRKELGKVQVTLQKWQSFVSQNMRNMWRIILSVSAEF